MTSLTHVSFRARLSQLKNRTVPTALQSGTIDEGPSGDPYPPVAKSEYQAAYLPLDRRRALATGVNLPERAAGSALFADISGFTALTNRLTESLGLRRGAEELPRHLDLVYEALTSTVHTLGGSVISFSGDAIRSEERRVGEGCRSRRSA